MRARNQSVNESAAVEPDRKTRAVIGNQPRCWRQRAPVRINDADINTLRFRREHIDGNGRSGQWNDDVWIPYFDAERKTRKISNDDVFLQRGKLWQDEIAV